MENENKDTTNTNLSQEETSKRKKIMKLPLRHHLKWNWGLTIAVAGLLIVLSIVVIGLWKSNKTIIEQFKGETKKTKLMLEVATDKSVFIKLCKEEVLHFNSKEEQVYEILSNTYEWCEYYKVPPYMLLGMIEVESSFNPIVVNDSSSATGLLQVTENTGELIAKYLGIPTYDLKDIGTNIRFGCCLMNLLLGKNNMKLSLQKYYGGEGKLFREQKAIDYANKVISASIKYQKLF
jgi:hypothetical protein